MNKKTTLIIAALVLVLVLALVLALGGNKDATADVKETETQRVTETAVESTVEPTAAAEATEEPTKEPTTEATEVPVVDETGISDAFIQENVNIGVTQGDGSGGDIVVDDSNPPPAQTQPTKPAETDKDKEPVTLTVPLTEITFEMYNSMSAAEQQAVIDSFGSMEDFIVWFNYIKAQYEQAHPDIEVGADGTVNLG